MDKNKKGRYPRAALVNAPIYHYGNARSINTMREKNQRIGRYWGKNHPLFNGYQIDPRSIFPFTGKHPSLAQNWIDNEAEQNFTPNPNHILTKREIKHRWMMKLERLFNFRFTTSKHHKVIK